MDYTNRDVRYPRNALNLITHSLANLMTVRLREMLLYDISCDIEMSPLRY